MTLTYMNENAQGGPAQQSDVQAWANQFGQNGIVAYSNYQAVSYPFGVNQGGGSWSIALPGTMLVGTGMSIAKVGEPTNAEIMAALP